MTYNETMDELEKIESLKEKILLQFQRDEISAEEEEASNNALSERAKEVIFSGSEFTEIPNGKEVFTYMWEQLELPSSSVEAGMEVLHWAPIIAEAIRISNK